MGRDSRDDDSPAPLPPHDRSWRHPSELGEWQHESTARVTTPPPLSRRTTTIVALLSAACSIAVIAVAIPRETRDKPPAAEATPTTTFEDSLLVTQRLVTQARVHVGRGEVPAIAIRVNGSSVIVSNADDVHDVVTEVTVSSVDGTREFASVLDKDPESGLAILQIQAAPNGPTESVNHLGSALTTQTIGDANSTSMIVFDPVSNSIEFVRRGISMSANSRLIPLDLPSSLAGVTAVSDSHGMLIGVAIERHHTAWLVPISLVNEVVARALAR